MDHCDRRCVREDHLRDISNFENARRNRKDAVTNLATCLNGHDAPIIEKVRNGKVWRTCSECHRLRNERYNAKDSTKERKREWARQNRVRA